LTFARAAAVGIEYQDMRAILRVLKTEMPAPSGKLLILGDAVIHFAPRELQNLAKQEGVGLRTLPESLTPFSLGVSLGFSQVDTLDINGKASINLDLQNPLPSELLGQYDLVIDAGVLFWCFEPGQVLKNIFRLTKVSGLIFHITALSGYFGRGYYNIHPRLFEDFYLRNQCVFIQSSFRAKPRLTCWERLNRSMARLLRLVDDNTTGVSYSGSPGAIYLGRARHDYMEFAKTLPALESDMIPNNVVSTFACRKTSAIEPSRPLQIC
jgi:hypothetical protein